MGANLRQNALGTLLSLLTCVAHLALELSADVTKSFGSMSRPIAIASPSTISLGIGEGFEFVKGSRLPILRWCDFLSPKKMDPNIVAGSLSKTLHSRPTAMPCVAS